MGKIKSKSVKKTASILIKKGEFTDSFEENKKVLDNLLPSKKIRNQVAGLLAKLKKRENKLNAQK